MYQQQHVTLTRVIFRATHSFVLYLVWLILLHLHATFCPFIWTTHNPGQVLVISYWVIRLSKFTTKSVMSYLLSSLFKRTSKVMLFYKPSHLNVFLQGWYKNMLSWGSLMCYYIRSHDHSIYFVMCNLCTCIDAIKLLYQRRGLCVCSLLDIYEIRNNCTLKININNVSTGAR